MVSAKFALLIALLLPGIAQAEHSVLVPAPAALPRSPQLQAALDIKHSIAGLVARIAGVRRDDNELVAFSLNLYGRTLDDVKSDIVAGVLNSSDYFDEQILLAKTADDERKWETVRGMLESKCIVLVPRSDPDAGHASVAIVINGWLVGFKSRSTAPLNYDAPKSPPVPRAEPQQIYRPYNPQRCYPNNDR
jgi:hypothetical protein